MSSDFILKPGERHWPQRPLFLDSSVDRMQPTWAEWSHDLDDIVIPARWGLYEETEDTGAILGVAADRAATQTCRSATVRSSARARCL